VGTRGGGSLNIKKRRLPRDLLIESDRHRFTIVQLILLAGVKNVSTQAFMRDYHGPMMRGVEGLTQWLLAAMMYAPASSTDFSYCTGQTFFVQSQLRLAWVQSASTPASQQSPRRVRLRSTKYLRRLVEMCHVVFRGRDRLPVPTTGSEYVQLSLQLTNVIKLSFQRIGDYTGARISRAVLCCTPTVTEGWDRVTFWQIHGISADQNDCYWSFLTEHGSDHTAADYARLMGCDRPELITMWHCLEKGVMGGVAPPVCIL
jgi:hypothetical protein